MRRQGFVSPALIAAAAGTLILALAGANYWQYRKGQELAARAATANAAAQRNLELYLQAVANHDEERRRWDQQRTAMEESARANADALIETHKQMAAARAEADDYRKRYERGRLERLSAEKPGLLTRLAKEGAKRRNAEWMQRAKGPGQ